MRNTVTNTHAFHLIISIRRCIPEPLYSTSPHAYAHCVHLNFGPACSLDQISKRLLDAVPPMLQVGAVDTNGFTARVMVPPCVTADLTKTQVVVPYFALTTMNTSDSFVHRVRLNKLESDPGYDAQVKAYTNQSWLPASVRR